MNGDAWMTEKKIIEVFWCHSNHLETGKWARFLPEWSSPSFDSFSALHWLLPCVNAVVHRASHSRRAAQQSVAKLNILLRSLSAVGYALPAILGCPNHLHGAWKQHIRPLRLNKSCDAMVSKTESLFSKRKHAEIRRCILWQRQMSSHWTRQEKREVTLLWVLFWLSDLNGRRRAAQQRRHWSLLVLPWRCWSLSDER